MTSNVEDNKMNTTLTDSPIATVSPVGFSTTVPEGYRTPPRAVSATTPPAAPLRVRRAESFTGDEDTDTSPDAACRCLGHRMGTVARVLIPSVDDHKGKGILAGDFIKSDPSATLHERHTYILTELHRWLTGRIEVHAREVGLVDTDQVEIADGMWPAARLHMIVQARTMAVEDSRVAPELIYHDAATWAASICMQYLIEGVEPDNSVSDMAVGFVRDDRLPDGRTIAELWDEPSVFEPLRTAVPLSLDDRIDAALEFWDIPLKLELPIWVWVVIILWMVLYAWIVAYLVSGPVR
jgi:hypothetical protein